MGKMGYGVGMSSHEFLDDEFQGGFEKNTISRKTKNGYSVKCRKGLWAVSGPNKKFVEKEAMRYFVQYYMDGEYN